MNAKGRRYYKRCPEGCQPASRLTFCVESPEKEWYDGTISKEISIKRTAILGILALLTGLPAFGQGIESVPPQKAFELVKQPATYLVDVRSVAEYVLVGHPETAHNVPFMFWNEDEARFVANERFIEDLKARFKPGDTLVFICRGGGRSLKAAAAAREAGFEKVVNVGEGFEGAADEKGYRTKGGWKNSLPYTYKIDPALTYRKS